METRKLLIHAFSIMVFLLLLSVYFSLFPETSATRVVSKAAAYAATLLIGFSLALGPLSRYIPSVFSHELRDRKSLGLWGYALAILHTILAFNGAYKLNVFLMLSPENSNLYPAVLALVAIAIFTIMAATSNTASIRKLGVPKWKALQRSGYVAFFLVLLHFTLLSNYRFVSTLHGQLLFLGVLVVILLKVLSVFHPFQRRNKYYTFIKGGNSSNEGKSESKN